MKLREAEQVDNILETFPHDFWFKTITEYWPTSVSTKKYHCSKDGCPVVYERIGLVHPKLAELIPMDTLLRHHLYNVELMEMENRKIVEKNGLTAGTILIEELQDLTTSHMHGKVTKLITSISARDEASYPESIRKVYIVNPPTIFQMVWAIMKPFIEERTQAKFAFGPAKDFKEEWDKIIGLENIPKYLGGTLEWDIPKGGSIKPYVPPMTTVEVVRKAIHQFEVEVKKGQTLHIEFLVKSGKDIGFALFVKTGKDSKKDRKEVEEHKLKKIDEENTPHHAKVTATENTTYIALLDNADSPFLGREITYHYYIKDPIESETKK